MVTKGNGTVYVTSGGGGYGLYAAHSHPLVAVRHSVHHYLRVDVANSRLNVSAIGLTGEEIDSFDLAPLPEVGDSVEILSTSDTLPMRVLKIRGRNLAVVPQSAFEAAQPFELLGTSVTANGQPLPLLKVSHGRDRGAVCRSAGRAACAGSDNSKRSRSETGRRAGHPTGQGAR